MSSPRKVLAQDAPAESLTTARLTSSNQKIIQQQDQQRQYPNQQNKRTLYFAYGSNLSPSQMRLRCEHDPSISGRPVALARLDYWRWLICERGYANVIPPRGWRVGRQVGYAEGVPKSSVEEELSQEERLEGKQEEKDVVFGVLYEMTAEDEYLLDGYEGVDHFAPESVFSQRIALHVRPREQENGAYNKWYVPAQVVKRLVDDDSTLAAVGEQVRVLVYVDEKRVSLGPPKWEYIGRMNRAIAESMQLGIPRNWVRSVMRKAIPEE